MNIQLLVGRAQHHLAPTQHKAECLYPNKVSRPSGKLAEGRQGVLLSDEERCIGKHYELLNHAPFGPRVHRVSTYSCQLPDRCPPTTQDVLRGA